MKKGEHLNLDIRRLGINGEGIGFYNRMAIFVENAIPSEKHEVVLTRCENKMIFAKSVQCLKTSPNRKKAECPYYESCGGCSVMHIDYNKMLELKRDILIESLNRYTKLNVRSFEIRPTIPSELFFHYRNKSQLPLKKINDSTMICMTRPQSTDLIPIKECMVNDSLINELYEKILKYIDELHISSYLYKFKRGVLRYLVIRVNKQNEAQICFVCAEKSEKIRMLAKKVIEIEEVKSVYENFNDSKKQALIFGEKTNLLAGEPYITETLGNVRYQLYPTTFFQLNSYQAEQMYNVILKSCKLSHKERVLDAYCGVGAIGLYLAKLAKEVIGIENNPVSVYAAKENAKMNKIKNAEFYVGDVEKLLPEFIEKGICFDVVVCDPPRGGLGKDLIQTLLNAEIRRIVYASCNPATFSKDLDMLSTKYTVQCITPLDMFPQTPLVESVCQLALKD